MPPQAETTSWQRQPLRNMRVTVVRESRLGWWKARTIMAAEVRAPMMSQLRRRIQKSVTGLQKK